MVLTLILIGFIFTLWFGIVIGIVAGIVIGQDRTCEKKKKTGNVQGRTHKI